VLEVVVVVKAALTGVQSWGERNRGGSSQGSVDMYENILHLCYN
jgi:hypothetical protein